MYTRIIHQRTLKNGSTALGVILVAWLLLRYPDAVYNGISRGLSISGTVIIPTLFPFMLLAGWLTDSSLCRHPGPLAQKAARYLFGLPGCCAPAILLSLVGGYPAGMIAVSRLYRQGQLGREELRRMTAFCVCSGPGFTINTVGGGLIGSRQAGWLLYVAQVITVLGIGIGLGRKKRLCSNMPMPAPPPRRHVAQMVADGCQSLLTMCGFVTMAAMGISIMESIGISRRFASLLGVPSNYISSAAAGILEVSCGCIALSETLPSPFWLSLCIGWGGLSVHGQLAAMLPDEKLLGGWFWLWRIVHGILSGGLSLLLFYLFPPKQAVYGPAFSPLPFSVSASATYMLLILCFLTMLCFSEKKTGKSV